ncbi:hypothetical protein BO71DRAFT_448205 [Aspergillus ellipticus CBS 707.79]|uniref:Zn(2)-C6 fungal-type domain-containing protein n=1 Tax=Aspergillus ellipticus CBS 707.79 TaxID=1448320 RepID=A0A319DJK6_9EURO|nr:hypothetical protein BO71DRAFT_448205 [Aspergillus ellipticus CBS 707.79]
MASNLQSVSRRRLKTRDGCLRCKQRRIKCDETFPACSQYTRKSFECPGYKRPLKWSSKYEVGGSASGVAAKPPGPHMPQLEELIQTLHSHFTAPAILDESAHSSCANEGPKASQNETASPNPVFISCPSTPRTNDVCAEETFSTPEDHDMTLLQHYFSNVCPLNSCFDSHKNFFRVEVGALISSCPLIHHCVLAMSAAHLAARQGDMITITLRHRTNALSCLKAKIATGFTAREANHESVLDSTAEVLLGSILLGMTEGWHDLPQLGLTHLLGARTLFRKWIVSSPARCPRTRSMLTGIMSYWEAVTSFFHNQSHDSISYLMPFCVEEEASSVYVNPWTGICTPLFFHLAHAGILTRQRSLLRQMSMVFGEQTDSEIVQRARAVESSLLQYRIPPTDRIEDTVDSKTPVDHLQRLARIYRLACLLQLYMAFPELDPRSVDEMTYPLGTLDAQTWMDSNRFHSILNLATNVLAAVGVFPPISGVHGWLLIPLILAGSALQLPCRSSDVLAPSLQEDSSLFWRNFVRQGIDTIQKIIGVSSIGRAQEILDRVWLLSGIQRAAEEVVQDNAYVQWTEVMSSEKLETVFG